MGKGECARRVNFLHSVEMSEESLPYQHGSCCVTLEDRATFFYISPEAVATNTGVTWPPSGRHGEVA
jgi:hypothetical protein